MHGAAATQRHGSTRPLRPSDNAGTGAPLITRVGSVAWGATCLDQHTYRNYWPDGDAGTEAPLPTARQGRISGVNARAGASLNTVINTAGRQILFGNPSHPCKIKFTEHNMPSDRIQTGASSRYGRNATKAGPARKFELQTIYRREQRGI